jgi:hypothetical protein
MSELAQETSLRYPSLSHERAVDLTVVVCWYVYETIRFDEHSDIYTWCGVHHKKLSSESRQVLSIVASAQTCVSTLACARKGVT